MIANLVGQTPEVTTFEIDPSDLFDEIDIDALETKLARHDITNTFYHNFKFSKAVFDSGEHLCLKACVSFDRRGVFYPNTEIEVRSSTIYAINSIGVKPSNGVDPYSYKYSSVTASQLTAMLHAIKTCIEG
ncbi:MAG: hypothetical protein ACRCXZ_00705 [Patescibacteria group bacterium]